MEKYVLECYGLVMKYCDESNDNNNAIEKYTGLI